MKVLVWIASHWKVCYGTLAVLNSILCVVNVFTQNYWGLAFGIFAISFMVLADNLMGNKP